MNLLQHVILVPEVLYDFERRDEVHGTALQGKRFGIEVRFHYLKALLATPLEKPFINIRAYDTLRP
jgi:hypothetical protein